MDPKSYHPSLTAAQRQKICRDRRSPEKVAQVNANLKKKYDNRSPEQVNNDKKRMKIINSNRPSIAAMSEENRQTRREQVLARVRLYREREKRKADEEKVQQAQLRCALRRHVNSELAGSGCTSDSDADQWNEFWSDDDHPSDMDDTWMPYVNDDDNVPEDCDDNDGDESEDTDDEEENNEWDITDPPPEDDLFDNAVAIEGPVHLIATTVCDNCQRQQLSPQPPPIISILHQFLVCGQNKNIETTNFGTDPTNGNQSWSPRIFHPVPTLQGVPIQPGYYE